MDFAAAMPLAGTLGVTIQEGTRERVTGRLPVRPDICTAGNIVHGGAIMAFADCLGAVGAFLTLPDGASGTTTIESKTNFLRPIRIGDTAHGRCIALHKGRTTMVLQTTITRDDGKVAAIVTQTQMIMEWRDPA